MRSLSLSLPLVTQVCGFFPLPFRVSSASGLFFTLVCRRGVCSDVVLGRMRLASLPVGDFFLSFLNRQLALTSFFYFTH